MIETAFGNREEAERAVRELLKRKLVASCQVVKSDSCWNWRGKLEQGTEYLMLMKTRKALQGQIYAVIREIHSYECFEFAVFELGSWSREYLNWIEQETDTGE